MRPADLGAWTVAAGFNAIEAEPRHDADMTAALRAHGLGFGPMRIRASLADSDLAMRATAIETAQQVIDRASEA